MWEKNRKQEKETRKIRFRTLFEFEMFTVVSPRRQCSKFFHSFVESIKFDSISVNNILDTIHKTPACCIYHQMWETHGLNFNTREKFVCSAPKWLIPVALVYFIDFQFLCTPLKSRTLIIVSNLFILNIFQVSLVSISISTLILFLWQNWFTFLLFSGSLEIFAYGRTA